MVAMAHQHSMNSLSFSYLLFHYFHIPLTSTNIPEQAAQLAYMMEDNKEKALKDVAEATMKEKVIVSENAEAQALAAEKDRALAEQQRADVEVKLGEVELRVAKAECIVTAWDKEIAKLKAALEESENKYYNMGLNDAENSAKPIMSENRKYGFGEGWMDAMATMGLPKYSLLRNPDQIPYLKPPPPTTQNPTEAEDDDTPSMWELVEAIDSHAKLIDLEITSNPNLIPTLAQP